MGEIFKVKVDIGYAITQLGSKVITQVFRVQMVKISAAFNEGAAGLRHLSAVNRNKAVNVNAGRFTVSRTFEHRRPEQAVEVSNVFTNKVVQLGIGVGFPETVEVYVVAGAEILKAGHVAYRCIYPNVEEFIRCPRNFKAEIRRIAADIPLL